jgi:acyl-CoA thioesterase
MPAKKKKKPFNLLNDYYKIAFVKDLGIKIIDIKEDEATGIMMVTKRMGNYMEYLHGGVVASLIDTVAFFPRRLLPSGIKFTTTSMEVKYFRPVSIGELLTAEAHITHLGKKVGVIEVSVFNPDRKLVAKGVVSVLTIS